MASYNDKNKIKEAYRVFEGKNIEKVYYSYDNEGKLIAENWYLNNVFTNKKTYHYSNNNTVVEKIVYDNKEQISTKEISIYNTAGMLTEESKYNFRDVLRGKTVCIYNETEQLIEEQNYDHNNVLESKMVFIYDDKGNVKEENWYNSKNQLTTGIEYTYTFDSIGNWIEKKEYDKETQTGTIYKRKISYY